MEIRITEKKLPEEVEELLMKPLLTSYNKNIIRMFAKNQMEIMIDLNSGTFKKGHSLENGEFITEVERKNDAVADFFRYIIQEAEK